MNDDGDLNADLIECEKAAEALTAAFDWGESKEGFAYWETIYRRLLRIAEKAKAQP